MSAVGDVFICLHVHDSTALILTFIILWLFGKLPVEAAGFTEKGMLPKFRGGEACPLSSLGDAWEFLSCIKEIC